MELKLANYWNSIHRSLFPNHMPSKGEAYKANPFFPDLKSMVPEESTEKHKELMITLDMINFERFMYESPFNDRAGRPRCSRIAMCKAFTAKSVFNIPTTKALLDRLHVDIVLRRICGFESKSKVPSEGTFSNAFKEISEENLLGFIHKKTIEDHYDSKLIEHISRDSTQINSREKPLKKVKKEKEESAPRGRPKKGEIRPPKEKTRLEKQQEMTIAEMLQDLPKSADRGTKKNAKGYKVSWNGYKLHLDVADGGIITTALLTSASVHDSQVAIPLEALTTKRVESLYSLMDAAYDSSEIKKYIESCGKIPVIDPNKRRGEVIPLDPPKINRYKNRSTAERANAQLKDGFGGRFVQVKGADKVMAHLMFGVLSMTAHQLIRYFG